MGIGTTDSSLQIGTKACVLHPIPCCLNSLLRNSLWKEAQKWAYDPGKKDNGFREGFWREVSIQPNLEGLVGGGKGARAQQEPLYVYTHGVDKVTVQPCSVART